MIACLIHCGMGFLVGTMARVDSCLCHSATARFYPRENGRIVASEEDALKIQFDLITRDPAVMNGQPCIRGMRLTVRRVLEAMATYPDRNELFAEYPELTEEDLKQVLAFAAASLDDKTLELRSA